MLNVIPGRKLIREGLQIHRRTRATARLAASARRAVGPRPLHGPRAGLGAERVGIEAACRVPNRPCLVHSLSSGGGFRRSWWLCTVDRLSFPSGLVAGPVDGDHRRAVHRAADRERPACRRPKSPRFRTACRPSKRPKDVQQLAQVLVQHGKLTKYQAQAVYQGKTKGLVFGQYVVLDKLGEGGMGVVLKAQHRRMDRLVAIKVLSSAAMKQAGAVERFHREVKAAAKLSHPNIVTAYDADEHQGMHYLAMEYVEGKDLATIVKERGPLGVREAVDCILQAARGLQYAHGEGIVHRDIKPGNLLLDKKGTVKILDMGLARIAGADAAMGGPERLTTTGQVMGTCDYMSPEQAFDSHEPTIVPTSMPWAARSTAC